MEADGLRSQPRRTAAWSRIHLGWRISLLATENQRALEPGAGETDGTSGGIVGGPMGKARPWALVICRACPREGLAAQRVIRSLAEGARSGEVGVHRRLEDRRLLGLLLSREESPHVLLINAQVLQQVRPIQEEGQSGPRRGACEERSPI